MTTRLFLTINDIKNDDLIRDPKDCSWMLRRLISEVIESKVLSIPKVKERLLRLTGQFYDGSVIIKFPCDDLLGGNGSLIFIPFDNGYLNFESFPEFKKCRITIYSCKPFNGSRVIMFLKRKFSGSIHIDYTTNDYVDVGEKI